MKKIIAVTVLSLFLLGVGSANLALSQTVDLAVRITDTFFSAEAAPLHYRRHQPKLQHRLHRINPMAIIWLC